MWSLIVFMSLAAILQKARIAEEAGACAVMALERVPADIRASGGVARMASARLSSQSIMVIDSLPLWFRVIPT
jgi:pyridoxal 5'-phosphate synthase pdxS subunit